MIARRLNPGMLRLLLLLALIASSPGQTAVTLQSGAGKIVPSTLFDLNVINLEWGASWPAVPFSSWRSFVSVWSHIEKTRGQFDFRAVDRDVALAEQHHVSMLLVLQAPPTWASARPTEPGCCGPDAPPGNRAAPDKLQDWERYVRTIVTRYRGRPVA